MDTLSQLEEGRKCWRLVNGVLFEKTKADVVPELKGQCGNMDGVIKQLSEAVAAKKQEIGKLEQQYESVMKQSKEKSTQQQAKSEVKAGGVLV
jgi:prefoldin subunit 2